jgi:SAM-dependent methyltransferase
MANLDPCWAILSDPAKRYGGWDVHELLTTGELEIAGLMERTRHLERPLGRERALDFGCGVGRLTRALSPHFDDCLGLDISDQMVTAARRLNADLPNCRFEVNARPDLSLLADRSVDLVYTRLVLQHLPSQEAILRYAAEFVRVLASGGLAVLQVPSYIPPLRLIQPRPRLYRALRRMGMPRSMLYGRLRLQPIRMRAVALPEMAACLRRSGAQLLDAETELVTGGLRSTTYYATR